MSESLQFNVPDAEKHPVTTHRLPLYEGEIGYDSEGKKWVAVEAHFTEAERKEIEGEDSPTAFWDKNLQMISDDAEDSIDDLLGGNKEKEGERADTDSGSKKALRWRPLED